MPSRSSRKKDLRDYEKYKVVLTAFQTHFGLHDFTFKQIDKFLWFTKSKLDTGEASK